MDVGTGPGLDRAGQDYGVIGGRLAGISLAGDSGRVSRQQMSPLVGPFSVDRDPTLTKAKKSSLQACPRSLLVSGKHRFSFPLVASSTFDLVLPSGSLGKDVSSSLGLPFPLFHPHSELAFCSLSPPRL